MLADADTFLAADAVGGVLYFDVAMSEHINLAEYMFLASIEALPAGHAIVRIDGYVSRLAAFTQFVEYSHSFFECKITVFC